MRPSAANMLALLAPPSDRDLELVLAVIEDGDPAALIAAALRDKGNDAPAQAIFTLKLAGYTFKLPVHSNGSASIGYRLRTPTPDGSHESPGHRRLDR